jgi:hypothetical protein
MSIIQRLSAWHRKVRVGSLAIASMNIFVLGFAGIYFIQKFNQWRMQKIEHYKEALVYLNLFKEKIFYIKGNLIET